MLFKVTETTEACNEILIENPCFILQFTIAVNMNNIRYMCILLILFGKRA